MLMGYGALSVHIHGVALMDIFSAKHSVTMDKVIFII